MLQKREQNPFLPKENPLWLRECCGVDLPETAGPLQACLQCFSLLKSNHVTWTPLSFKMELLSSDMHKEISRKNTAAIHILKACRGRRPDLSGCCSPDGTDAVSQTSRDTSVKEKPNFYVLCICYDVFMPFPTGYYSSFFLWIPKVRYSRISFSKDKN